MKKHLNEHYDLRVIIAIGFKINNESAVQFRKWANQTKTTRMCNLSLHSV